MQDRELIELLAVRVMGWHYEEYEPLGWWFDAQQQEVARQDWDPLGNAADSEQLMEKIRGMLFSKRRAFNLALKQVIDERLELTEPIHWSEVPLMMTLRDKAIAAAKSVGVENS